VWLACGVYDEAVRDENAVHDLEHGTVWITHDPGLPADDVERLAAELPDNGIMSRNGALGLSWWLPWMRNTNHFTAGTSSSQWNR